MRCSSKYLDFSLISPSLAGIFFLCLLLVPGTARAGDWRVIPIRLDFTQSTRSGVITVNNDADKPLHLAVAADRWSEDAHGKDRYTPSTDLIFFPQQLTVPPKKERVIRVGIKVPAIQNEKTYRLFIREIPGRPDLSDTGVAIAIRFGVPIFAAPVKKTMRLHIGQLTLREGTLGFTLKNTGNVHARIQSIQVSGKNTLKNEDFSKNINGWYLLTGASRPYTLKIPRGVCDTLKTVDVQVKTEHAEFTGKIDVDKANCHSQ